MTEWKITLKTAPNTWSIITVSAADHIAAVRIARRLLDAPDAPVTEII